MLVDMDLGVLISIPVFRGWLKTCEEVGGDMQRKILLRFEDEQM
jgi:hypothetical protein